MAKVKMGTVVVGLRGTIGGLTFSANKAGDHARAWSRPPNARTPPQSSRRASLATISMHWRDLSASDQSDWNALALIEPQYDAFANTYYLSGFQRYQKFNIHRASVARSILDGPPLETIPAAPTISAVVVSAGASPCTYTYAALEFGPTYDAVLLIRMGHSLGQLAPPGTPLFVKGDQLPAGTSVDFTTELATVYGPVSEYQRAFWQICRQLPSGFRSAPSTGYVDVIA